MKHVREVNLKTYLQTLEIESLQVEPSNLHPNTELASSPTAPRSDRRLPVFRHAFSVVLGVICFMVVPGCGTVKSAVSVVPGASYMPGLTEDASTGPKVGETLHFKISPDEALEILADVAPAHEWELDAVGEQYDLEGLRGKYFRLLKRRFIGGVYEMNGVFFSEPEGTYVVVGKKNTGLPQELVTPFTAAVEASTGAAKAP